MGEIGAIILMSVTGVTALASAVFSIFMLYETIWKKGAASCAE